MFRKAALRGDLDRLCDRFHGSRARRLIKALATPGTQAIIVYRFGNWQRQRSPLLRWPLEPAYRLAYLLTRCLWGIELPRTAKIGSGLIIGHFGGIVVSGDAVIGRNCTLMHDVTIGRSGDGVRDGVPEIGNDVFIGPGAKVFGKIRVGHNVKIGANAVVHKDVPDNAVAALSPGFHILSLRGNRRHSPPQPVA